MEWTNGASLGTWFSIGGQWRIDHNGGYDVSMKVSEGLGNMGYKRDWLRLHYVKTLDEAKAKAGDTASTVLSI
jgi:hypothetical protein